MKKALFILAFTLIGTYGFAENTTSEKPKSTETEVNFENTSELNSLQTIVETKVLFGEIVCTRTCTYVGGELVGCTDWECVRVATENLPPIIINV